MKKENNYLELMLRLARTDFKLRYQGSFLGYIWAILKPLLLFTILNFVFSTVFNTRNNGVPFYSLQLLTGLLLFNFFSEGTMAGLTSLVAKAQLVTKIYVPRWILVMASTLNALFIFLPTS
jgi:ABC-2 type transport system permease protein